MMETSMIQAVLFDVNETLLDTRSLEPYFSRLFGDVSVRERWFQQLENLWLTAIAINQYYDFDKLVEAALLMVTGSTNIIPSVPDRTGLSKSLEKMSPHTDVLSSLGKLTETGLRLAVLTNGTRKSLDSQIHHARLDGYFELLLSADEVRQYKPAPEPYDLACRRLTMNPGSVLLVTCHAWDIAGGHAAGLKTAFIRRERKALNPLSPRPDFEFNDLHSLSKFMNRQEFQRSA
jgi:2-haloacid dehalogenase